ncbi:site-specific DNA-methyltransferase [Wielerella bovis]|uniref:site-specific DNA-methyltransferase n=1 Tax=Wielerella bovis TaxID=2917790 RepID=UPI002018F120|nr:site-specific DNA-methyltransferase [Wielerella bovis]ULJ68941.1 site-specific DNA-methyltransferase [Wielerella bovis]
MPELMWSGKDKVKFHHHDVPFYLLNQQYHFVAEEGKPQNREDNILIHGDNLLALKSLLPEFGGKINCIYIDPPYNTGNENWVYNDNVNDSRIQKWLGEVVGKEGEDFSRHDKWLCMMYPRLKLLKQLLADDGVIFISIDDNEQACLKLICDEIFGYGNFVAQFSIKRQGGRQDSKFFAKITEYIFCYAKNSNQFISGQDIKENESYPKFDKNKQQFYKTQLLRKWGNSSLKQDRPNLYYAIPAPDGNDVFPIIYSDNGEKIDGRWRWKPKKMEKALKDGLIEFIKDKNNNWIAYEKIFQPESGGKSKKFSTWLEKLNVSGSAELKDIFGSSVFDYPKPPQLLELILKMANVNKNAIILDSFSGSGTTAHAVLSLNKDGGNRRFIGVEMMDYAETITAERIRRVINGYGNKPETQNGTGGGFTFYTIGDPLFIAPDTLNPNASLAAIRQYIGYTENLQQTWQPENGVSPHALGYQNGTAYVFYYEQDEVTTLDLPFLQTLQATGLPEKPECWVIYADKVVLTESQLKTFNIVFKRIPRDISRF